jgi:NCS1 family nucleobase:cation symporter-1
VRKTTAEIEDHTIYPIPAAERHGRASDLFTVWFGSNIMILTIVTGALATTRFQLPLIAAVLAIVIGNLVGGVFMALHAAQGPQLGVPQMVQSRGQFGSFGAIFVVALVVIMYLGFVASNLVLGGQSLHSIVRGISDQAGIVAITLLSLAAAIYGYDLIHAYARWMTWVCGAALAACFFWIIAIDGLPQDIWQRGDATANGVLGMISVGALWQIAYAPYVSDYSRYMPADSGVRPAFWASYWGCVLGSVLPMMLGALLGLVTRGGIVAGLAQVTQPISIAIVLVFSLGIGAATAMNVYCGVLSSITVAQTFAPRWRAGIAARIVLSVIFSALALAMALWGAKNFMVNYENFLSLLLCVMAPWTAVNLVDFYLIQHGRYDVQSFFLRDGGIYGRYNAVALFCYGLGILVQVPFLATDLFTGPIAKALGGADISWLIALAVVSPLYYVLARRRARRGTLAIPQSG